MMNILKTCFLFPWQRMAFLYLIVFGISYFVLEHKESRFHATGASLSRLQPPYEYLVNFSDGKVPYVKQEFEAFRLFYTQLLKFLPERPDAYGMLGFCHYQLGDTDKAIDAYKKAADITPTFLWFNHNLGYLYYQKKDYAAAAEYLNYAIVANADVVFKFLLNSKVYRDAIASVPDFQQQFYRRLKVGLRDSFKMLVLSYHHLKQHERVALAAELAVNQKLDDDGFFLYYLGASAFQLGQFDRALAYLQQVIQKSPQAAEAYYYLALVFRALNKESLAVIMLQKAKELQEARGTSFEDINAIRLRIF